MAHSAATLALVVLAFLAQLASAAKHKHTAHKNPLESQGQVQFCLSNPNTCTELNLFGEFTSTMPTEVGLMAALTNIYMLAPKVTGTMPTEVGLLTALATMGLEMTAMTGSLPTEVGMLAALKDIKLKDDGFSGALPTELGKLGANLAHIDMGRNALTGTVPTEVGMLTSLTSIYMAFNSLSGIVPYEISNLKQLQVKWRPGRPVSFQNKNKNKKDKDEGDEDSLRSEGTPASAHALALLKSAGRTPALAAIGLMLVGVAVGFAAARSVGTRPRGSRSQPPPLV